MAGGQYKKRVIQQASDDSSGDDEIPLAKKQKSDETPTQSPATSTSIPTTIDASLPVTQPKTKLSIFTTGSESSSDNEDDKPPTHGNGNLNGNGKKRASEPIAKSYKQQLKDEDRKMKDAAKPVVPPPKAEEKEDVDMESPDEDDSSGDEDNEPLAAALLGARTSPSTSKSQPPPAAKPKPKSKPKAKPATPVKKGKKEVAKKASSEEPEDDDEEEDDEDDDEQEEEASSDESEEEPLSQKKGKAAKKAAPAPQAKPVPAPKKKKATPASPADAKREVKPKKGKREESASPVKKAKGKGKAKKEEGEDAAAESEDEVYRWWDEESDGTTKWKTLSHNGVLFPPEYEPHGVKMKYEGKPVELPPEAEEVASFFAAILETDYPKNPTFVKNFFEDWVDVMKIHPPLDGTKITTFSKCDFTPIFAYLEGEKAKKKEMTAAQKKVAKAAREILEEPYKTCLLDGRKENVGNFRVEPPGLFRGRGDHPKTGKLKTRVTPEMIRLNIGEDALIPPAPPGHKWKEVTHDNKVTWLATWKENINNAVKYVFLAAGSSLKGQSDYKKFEKARALKSHVDRVRADYTADLKHKEMAIRQRATAIYFIDKFALRNGNEKGDEEADTVGCCSLRFEHITLEPPTWVTFDFLGKDSIRYVNRVSVEEQVFKNLKIFKKAPKGVGDMLFDRLNTSVVNKYLSSYMEGLTAKVFRTYNASWTFVQQLEDTPTDASVADKILAYNRANRLVAVLCNHQRSVSKNHGVLMDKMADKTRALKYQRKKLRHALEATASAADKKKKYKEVLDEESDLDDEWIEAHETNLVTIEREKIRKKFDKENVKLAEEDAKPLPESELKERLKAADELEKSLKADKKNGWTDTKFTEEKLAAAIKKMDERIQVQKLAALDRDEGKEISLGTSKINYLDPRITVAWAKRNDVPLAKLLSKTLVTKFQWAMEAEADFDW